MGEIATCSVCGEPVKPYVDAAGAVLLHTAGPEHWRLGYERSQEALAAARRDLAAAAQVAESMLDRDDTGICMACGADTNNGEPSCDANCFRVKLVAALAAPAAGEEGKHG